VAQRLGARVPVLGVAGRTVGADALAAEAPVDGAVAMHLGVADEVVAGRTGPEVVVGDVHVADVVDQRAVEPALAVRRLVAHAGAAEDDHVVHLQAVVGALPARGVGGTDHGGAVGMADHRVVRGRPLVGSAQAFGEVDQRRGTIGRVVGLDRGRDGVRGVVAEPDDGGGVARAGHHLGLGAQVVHAVDRSADVGQVGAGAGHVDGDVVGDVGVADRGDDLGIGIAVRARRLVAEQEDAFVGRAVLRSLDPVQQILGIALVVAAGGVGAQRGHVGFVADFGRQAVHHPDLVGMGG